MSNSVRLSETLVGNVKNDQSQIQDFKIKSVIDKVLVMIREKYPNLRFGRDEKMSLSKIEELVSSQKKTQDKTYIKPDGGFLWVKINNQKYYILVSEQKKQGTNDRLFIEGKKKQSQGNAAERLGKNIDAFDVLFSFEDVCPVVVFLQGCDFYDQESTIGDRIRTIYGFQEMNKINLNWVQITPKKYIGGSFFMRGHSMFEKPGTSDWTFDEMYSILSQVAIGATDYYLKKYGKS